METRIAFGEELLSYAYAIREDVFIKEQGFQNEFDDIDACAWHVVIFVDGTAAATGRTFPEKDRPGVWHIGRVAVRKEYRGQQYGAAVMRALEEKLKDLNAKRIVLSAQVQARGFYEALGYTAHGCEYLDEHCPHVEMEKEIG